MISQKLSHRWSSALLYSMHQEKKNCKHKINTSCSFSGMLMLKYFFLLWKAHCVEASSKWMMTHIEEATRTLFLQQAVMQTTYQAATGNPCCHRHLLGMHRLVYCVCIHLAHIGRVDPYWACTTCTPSHPAYIMKGHPPWLGCAVFPISLYLSTRMIMIWH